MRINQITFVQTEAIPKSMRTTQASGAIAKILEELAKAPVGQSLVLTGEFKKYERYSLQKKLQKRGAKVIVQNGKHNGHDVLFVKRLTDKEWQEFMVPAGAVVGTKAAAKGGK